MASVTLAMPDDVSSEMERFAWVNWSGLAQEVIEKKLKVAELLLKADSMEEKEFADWAAKLVKEGRKGRFKALKSKGLV